MNARVVNLSAFTVEYPILGEWELKYTDRTHLKAGDCILLGRITVDHPANQIRNFPILPFRFESASLAELEKGFQRVFAEAGKSPTAKTVPEAAGIVTTQLAESVVRCGLVPPSLTILGREQDRSVWEELSSHRHLMIVTDTSALRRGIASFLISTLPRTPIWVVIPVFVLIEIQERAENIAATDGAGFDPYNYPIVRQRPQVNCVAREINNVKASSPVEFLGTPPELIGHVRGFKLEELRKGKDTLRDSVNDRLIIESVKNLKRERAITRGLYLLTADKNMANMAHLENIDAILVEVPKFPDDKDAQMSFDSLRFSSPYKEGDGEFVICPVHHFVWDLAHVFSTVRLQSTRNGSSFQVEYYSKDRVDWACDVLTVKGS